MKRWFQIPLALAPFALTVFLHPPISAQTKATATNVPTILHQPVVDFFKNPPGIYTGENMGIATNSKGNIYIFHRANETRLFEYSPQGGTSAFRSSTPTARSRVSSATLGLRLPSV